ncbi:MAG: hypothetical protein KAS32_27610 [Candidatus Peribacteraceae bacterium]|nr:hypothetical protein [Candidatus Peribacteraceae bacterium]
MKFGKSVGQIEEELLSGTGGNANIKASINYLVAEAAQIEKDADSQFDAGNINKKQYKQLQNRANSKRIEASKIHVVTGGAFSHGKVLSGGDGASKYLK